MIEAASDVITITESGGTNIKFTSGDSFLILTLGMDCELSSDTIDAEITPSPNDESVLIDFINIGGNDENYIATSQNLINAVINHIQLKHLEINLISIITSDVKSAKAHINVAHGRDLKITFNQHPNSKAPLSELFDHPEQPFSYYTGTFGETKITINLKNEY